MTFLHLRERLSGGCWTMKAYSFRALGATVILTERWLQRWKKKKEGVCVLLFCFLQPGMKNGVRRCVLGKDPKRELETRQPHWVITHMLISIFVPYKVLTFQIKPSLLLKYLHKSKTNSMECCMHSPLFLLWFTPWTVTPVCLRQGQARLKNAASSDEWMEKRESCVRVCFCCVSWSKAACSSARYSGWRFTYPEGSMKAASRFCLLCFFFSFFFEDLSITAEIGRLRAGHVCELGAAELQWTRT